MHIHADCLHYVKRCFCIRNKGHFVLKKCEFSSSKNQKQKKVKINVCNKISVVLKKGLQVKCWW